MSVAPEPCCDVRSPEPLPIRRWAILAGLLLAEILGITVAFDTAILDRSNAWWAHIFGQSSHALHMAIAAVGAVLLVRGVRPWTVAGVLDGPAAPARVWIAFLLGHLGAFAVFTAITAHVLSTDPNALTAGSLWFIAWLLTGMATLALWAAAALPPAAWGQLMRHGSGVLLAAIAIGGLAWGAGQLTNLLWQPLCRATFATVGGLLRITGADVVCIPERFVIGTTAFRVKVAPECSGYEGIGLIWVFLIVFLWVFRRDLRFPNALLLIPLGTAIIWMANAVRIAALIVLGSYGSRAVALGGFHSHAGWLAFIAVSLGLMFGARRSHFFGHVDQTTPTGHNPAAAYLGPLMALMGTAMVTGAFSTGFDRLYALRIIVATVVLWYYWDVYSDLRWTWSWLAVAIGIVVFALWMALEPAQTAANPVAELPTFSAAIWLVFRVIGSVAVVPLVEELAFRSFLIRRLMATDFTEVRPGQFSWLSFLVSSAAFGALHGRWFAGVLAGMAFAVALYRRRELTDAVVAHATTNALIAAYVVATGSWALWN